MSYSVEIREDSPVMLVQFQEGFGKDDLKAYLQEVRQTYNELQTPVYQILDVQRVKLGFDDIMEFLRLAFSGEGSAAKHPMNAGTLIVTDNRFYQMMARGLTSATFGGMKIQVYSTVEEALRWVNDQAA